ncbi:MAG: LmeA family phospholipid-binding protein [Microcoleaceae cyanobacterium]
MILPSNSSEVFPTSAKTDTDVDTLPNILPDDSLVVAEDVTQKSGSHIISKVLSPAIRVWLRSQLEEIKYLDFVIEGTDRQIWRGVIPTIHLDAKGAVYRGLHLSLAQLKTGEIKFSFGKVLKGKGWHLDHAIQVGGDIQVSISDLLVSVQSPLFRGAIADLLRKFLPGEIFNTLPSPLDINDLHLAINDVDSSLTKAEPVLQLTGKIRNINQQLIPFSLQTKLTLVSPQELLLKGLTWSMAEMNHVDDLKIFLGSDVYVNNLLVDANQLAIQGGFQVNP